MVERSETGFPPQQNRLKIDLFLRRYSVVLLFRDCYQGEHCGFLFWIGNTTCALCSWFSFKSLSKVRQHDLPQRGSVSHLCVAAGSQSLAAPLAAQAGPVPVLPERRHLLSCKHTHTDAVKKKCPPEMNSCIPVFTDMYLLTKIHRFVAPGADVGSSWERGEACSWRKEKKAIT